MKYVVRGTEKEVPLGSTLKIANGELLASIWVKVDCIPEVVDEPVLDPPAPDPEPDPIEVLYSHTGALTIPTTIDIGQNPLNAIEKGRITFSFNLNTMDTTQGLLSRDGAGNPSTGEVPHLSIYVTGGLLYARMQTPNNSLELVVSGIETGKVYNVLFEFFGDKLMLGVTNPDGSVVGQDFEEELTGFNWVGTTTRPLIIGALNWSNEISNVMNGTISDVVIKDIS